MFARTTELALGNGWRRGRLGLLGECAVYGDEFGACAQLEIGYADRHRQLIVAWRGGPSSVAADDLLLQTDCPSFLYPGHDGVTTVREWMGLDAARRRDEPARDDRLQLLRFRRAQTECTATIGGSAPLDTGHRRMYLRPRTGDGLTRAEAALRPRTVAWPTADGKLRLDDRLGRYDGSGPPPDAQITELAPRGHRHGGAA